MPHTETDSAALFALEEWKLSDRLDLSFGARLEHTRVDPDAKGNERFAENDGSQSFTTGSLSTGAVYKLTPIWSLAATLSYTKYEHKEIEDGETGTTFKNEGYEGRIEARHRPLGPLNGVVGAQFANSRFSALGEEAFITGSTVTPASPTAATTATMARRPRTTCA